MAIKKLTYAMAHRERQKQAGVRKRVIPQPTPDVDPKMTVAPPKETGLPYGRKGYEQGEGVDVRPGTFDRNTMNPWEEEEYPRASPFGGGHLRSMEDVT